MVDYNSKGEVRLRFKKDSPWNDSKEEKILRDVLLMKKESNKKTLNHVHKTENISDNLVIEFTRGYEGLFHKDITVKAVKGDDKTIN